jgi:3-phosphoshikimate 1-carboxyvinyltransferase
VLRAPSDKSLTHRAYIFAALAQGPSEVTSALRGEDCENTLQIVRSLGAEVLDQGGVVRIVPGPLRSPERDLDCGNSGTTMRLMAGVLASEPGLDATLVGDASLSRRPMWRIVEPLRLMGAEVEGDTAPLHVRGKRLRGIEYATPVASAQIKSCILLAGVRAEGETWVTEPAPSRDHTERMLESLGVEMMQRGTTTIGVTGGQTWDGFSFDVPADVSSAAFFMCAAAMVPGSRVVFADVGTNPTRTGVLEALSEAGAKIRVVPQEDRMGEPVSHVEIDHQEPLKAFEVSGDLVPRLIDEIPVLAVLATQCEGTTRIRDARELRVKESDRVEAVAKNLRAMGAQVETCEDGMDVTGPTPLRAATVDAEGDHRIGMAFAVAGLVAEGETTIVNAESIRTSYPGFQDDLEALSKRT